MTPTTSRRRGDRALPRALPDDGPDPRVRGSHPVALPARRDLRHDPSLHRAGGGRGRRGERPRGPRSPGRDLPRPRARARARRRPAGAARRDARPRHRRQRRARRLDEHQRARRTGSSARSGSSGGRSPPPPASVSPSSASAASPSASSATARSTRATSTSASTSARCCGCRSSSCARTTATASTRRSRTSPPASIRGRAEAMEVPAETVDGMSVVAVRAAAGRAVAHARAGGGPYFLEAITYRYVGHSRSDPGAYRPPGELDAWKERDPIPRLRGELVDAGVDPAIVDAIDTRGRRRCSQEMERRGLEAPFPEPRPTRGVQRVSQNVLRMPRLSDSMSEATIVGWLKQPGEAFLRGEPLVEVETDKATVVYEAEADGLLGGDPRARGRRRRARRADRPARRGDGDADVPRQSRAGGRRRGAASARRRPPRRLRRSPPRRRARGRRPSRAGPRSQLGVSLSGLDGTGPGGRIRKLDVRARPDRAAPAAGCRRRSTSRGPRRWSSCRRRARRSRAAWRSRGPRSRRSTSSCRSTCPRSSSSAAARATSSRRSRR